MPPAPRTSPLYSAVVLAGVSLTATAFTAACGDDDNTPKTGAADASTSSSSGGSSSGGSSSGGSSSGTTGDASTTTDTGTPTDACPPDSEIPTPPCVLIK